MTFYTRDSGGFVASTAAPIATGWSDPVAGRELHPLKIQAFPRRTQKYALRATTPDPDFGGLGRVFGVRMKTEVARK
jgi:hypothetical protein